MSGIICIWCGGSDYHRKYIERKSAYCNQPCEKAHAQEQELLKMAMHEETTLVRKYGPYAGKRVLEIGSNLPHSKSIRQETIGSEHIGLDQAAGQYVQVVHDLLNPLEGHGEFDTVLCFSVLEHTPEPWKLAANAEALVKQGGLLLVSVPFQWRVHNHPDDYFRYTPSGLRSLFKNVEILDEFSIPAMKLDSHQNGKIQIFLVGRKK